MKDECSSTYSYPDSSLKSLRKRIPFPLHSPGLMEVALEIEKLTEKSLCLQEEIDALMRDVLTLKNSMEDKVIKKRAFGSAI